VTLLKSTGYYGDQIPATLKKKYLILLNINAWFESFIRIHSTLEKNVEGLSTISLEANALS